MEMQQQGDLVKSTPTVEIKLDGDDTKYITSLSTILVATIQEAKDRISQMEYIFCSQLYPKFQTKARSLQDIYGEAKQAAEAKCREKENDLLQKIEKVKHDKEEVVAENQSLKVEMSELSGRLRLQQLKIDELGRLDKLLQGLEEELKLKGAELVKVKFVSGELQKKLEAKDAQLLEKEELLLDLEKEKEQLIAKSKYLEDTIRRLDEEMLQKKTAEAQEGKKFSKELHSDRSEATKNKPQLNGHEEEQKRLRYEVKLKDSQGCLGESRSRTGNLESELLEKKYNDLVQKHKSLTSQHVYLLRKYGYTSDNMLPQSRSVEQEHSLSREENQIDKLCITKKNVFEEGRIKVKEETDIDDYLEHEKEKSSSRSFPSTSREFITPRSDTRKSYSVVTGTKRPAGSSWIETRAHQNRGGPDPHDDFLDTPFENIKDNLNKAMTGEAKISPASSNVPEKMNNYISDDEDETQDMNVDPCPQKQQQRSVACDVKKSFKYVEPVRKKADRENLRGIECKQCKKFYDAVLPENEGKNKNDMRCEHHDGVSRHRYKYVPPMTPDGFWNIGFESEM